MLGLVFFSLLGLYLVASTDERAIRAHLCRKKKYISQCNSYTIGSGFSCLMANIGGFLFQLSRPIYVLLEGVLFSYKGVENFYLRD